MEFPLIFICIIFYVDVSFLDVHWCTVSYSFSFAIKLVLWDTGVEFVWVQLRLTDLGQKAVGNVCLLFSEQHGFDFWRSRLWMSVDPLPSLFHKFQQKNWCVPSSFYFPEPAFLVGHGGAWERRAPNRDLGKWREPLILVSVPFFLYLKFNNVSLRNPYYASSLLNIFLYNALCKKQ